MKKDSVLFSIATISALGIVAKAIGLFRQGVTASYFGTTAEMDVFSFLSSITTTLATLSFAVSVTYSPMFIENYKTQGMPEAGKKLSNLLNQYAIFSFAFFILVFLLCPLMPNFVGESANKVDNDTIILYSRLLFSTVILLGMSRIQVSALSALRRYGWLQITTIIESIISIVLIYIFGKKYGVSILVAAFIANAVIQFFILQKALFSGEMKYRFYIDVHDPQISHAWKNFIPTFLGVGTYLMGLTIDRTISLWLGIEGAASAFNYAGLFYGLINTIITTPIVTVFYTEMSRTFVDVGIKGLNESMNKTITNLIIILVPFAVLLFIESTDFITVILKRGKFDANSVEMTSQAFYFYALSTPILAIRGLLVRECIILKRNKLVMYNGIIFLSCNALFGYILSKYFGIVGISLGSFIGVLLSTVFMYFNVKSKCDFNYNFINRSVIKIVLSIIIAGIIIYSLNVVVTIDNTIIRFCTFSLIYCIIYLASLMVMKTPEAKMITDKIKKYIHIPNKK